MSSKKVFWKSVAQLDESNEIVHKLENNEFVEKIPVDEFLGDEDSMNQSSTNRRDFLKYVGFSTAAATLAGRQPEGSSTAAGRSSPAVAGQRLDSRRTADGQ